MKRMAPGFLILLGFLLVASWSRAADPVAPTVISPPETFFAKVRERDRDAARAFYGKYIDIHGLPVAASGVVADEALLQTHDFVSHMLAGRPDIVRAMIDQDMYLIIIGKDQVYTDMPEYRNSRNPEYLNERVRGTGGNPTSFGEENLIGYPLDRYDDESIAVHEFCHTIDNALRSIDADWTEKRNATFRHATQKGLHHLAYAATNPGEYWAEIAQAYFDCNRVNNWNHNSIGTREQLKVYDPEGYELVRSAFNLGIGRDWRYRPLVRRPQVVPPPERILANPYYTKFTMAREFTVLGRQAGDEAMLRANNIIRKMFAYRHDILKALMAEDLKLVVLGKSESLAELPELQRRKDVDFTARFLDYTPGIPLLVVAEESLLRPVDAPDVGSSPLVRIMAHTLYQVTGKRAVDPDWDNRPPRGRQQYELRVQRMDVRFDQSLEQAYDAAMREARWQGTAAVHDRANYWCEGVLAYFDAVGQEPPPRDVAHPMTTRERLKAYDPALYELVHETMAYAGRVDWRYP